MLRTEGRFFRLAAGAGLIGATGVMIAALTGSSGSMGTTVAFAATSVLLGVAIGSSGRPRTRSAVAALLMLGVVVLTVAAANAAGAPMRGTLSALGAVLAFLVCPLACAYGLRTSPDLRPGVIASAGVPLLFTASLILDGPLLSGVGPTIDAVDAVLVPVWLFVIAANLALRRGAASLAYAE
jgi:hypothetical protein